jgi:surface antigen
VNGAAANPNQRECRPYTADTTLSGSRAPVQGIACRGADGQWRLVSETPAR